MGGIIILLRRQRSFPSEKSHLQWSPVGSHKPLLMSPIFWITQEKLPFPPFFYFVYFLLAKTWTHFDRCCEFSLLCEIIPHPLPNTFYHVATYKQCGTVRSSPFSSFLLQGAECARVFFIFETLMRLIMLVRLLSSSILSLFLNFCIRVILRGDLNGPSNITPQMRFSQIPRITMSKIT